MGADTSVAARLDALLDIAREHAQSDEDTRLAAIAEALGDADAGEISTAAKARFDAITATGITDNDDLSAAAALLADVYTALLPAPDTAETAEAAESSSDDDSDDDGGTPDDEPDTDTDTTSEGDPVAIDGEIVNAITPAPGDETGGTPASIPEGTPVLTPAGLNAGTRHAFTRGNSGNLATRNRGRFRAIAAGDTHGYTPGQQFKAFGDIADVTMGKLRGLNDAGDGYIRSGIATWQEMQNPDLYPGMSALEAAEVLDKATDIKRLEYNARTMTFGQGWCRPSDVLLDLCPPASLDGMWDAPSITIAGGGIRYPVDPSFASIYSSTGFCYTEAQEIARTEDKPCFMVPCPDFDEVRLSFCGLCIEAGTLVDLAYPSLIAGYVAKALVAFQHRMNARALAEAWALATPNDMTTGTGALTSRGLPGLIATVLNTVAMNASHLRYKHRLSLTAPIEAVMPAFLRDMLQADAALRGAVENMLATTFTTIDSWFGARRIRPQWVYDFDDAYSDTNTAKWGGVNVPKDWPTTVKILLYPAGTFAVARRPMVNVSGVRNDPQLLRQNIFLALFMETAYAVVSRCPEAIALTIPTCVSGESVLTTIDMVSRCAPAGP